MKHIIRYYIAVFFVAFLLFAIVRQLTGNSDDLPAIEVPAELDSVIEIKRWLAIGPFEFDTLQTNVFDSFYTEDLEQFGITKGSISLAGIKKMTEKGIGVFIIDQRTVKIRLFNYMNDITKNTSNVYLVAKINSVKAQDAALILDGSHCYAGWLNGEKLIEIRKKYSTLKVGDRFVKVSLKKGENTLFFKVNRGTNKESWDLCCAIAPLHEADRIYRVNYDGDFVEKPVFNDSVIIYTGLYMSGKAEVLDFDNRIVAAGSFNYQLTDENSFVISGLDGLPDGFYKTILKVDGKRMEQTIYKGDYEKFVKQANDFVSKIDGSNSHIDDLKSAMYLVNFLRNSRPWNSESPSNSRYFCRNLVFWGYSLHSMLQNTAPATQIMTYRNENGYSREFIFHVGDSQHQNIPLIIVLPYEMITESLLEDWYTSNIDFIEGDNTLADEYGFAIAFIYAEGKNYSVDKTEKEITAVINRIETECNIDRGNIFLFGECVGGRRALVQLSRSPERYAACAVSSPITLSGNADDIPVNLIPQMGNTPIMIRHGINDEVVPIDHSRIFVAEARKYNLSIDYRESNDSHVYINNDYRRYAFEFFSRILGRQKYNN